VLLAAVMLIVYYLFAEFRQEEFIDRLVEKAETTSRLLVEVDEVDYQTLKIIDRNTVNRLYNEQILIFNDSMRLIYSSMDDPQMEWSPAELQQIKKEKAVVLKMNQYDVLELYFDLKKRDYFVLVSAEDKYGNRKLNYLRYLLLGAFFTGTALVWILSFYLSKKSLYPLDPVTSPGSLKASRVMKMDRVNPMPPRMPAPQRWPQRTPVGATGPAAPDSGYSRKAGPVPAPGTKAQFFIFSEKGAMVQQIEGGEDYDADRYRKLLR
jgi:hypothetical protein